MIILSLIFSLILTFLEHSGEKFSSEIILFICFYLIIFPCLIYIKPKFFKFINRHVSLLVILIMYYTCLIPFFGEIHKLFFMGNNFFILKMLHIFIILMSIFLILICIFKQIFLIIFNKRKITGMDIIRTFSIYFVLGFSFGSLYYLLNYEVSKNLFDGVLKPTSFNFKIYCTYMYISLGYLSTVGSGSITPLALSVRLLTVMETILGISITSFSLGFVFAVIGGNLSKTNQKCPRRKNINIFLFLKNFYKNLLIEFKRLQKESK